MVLPKVETDFTGDVETQSREVNGSEEEDKGI